MQKHGEETPQGMMSYSSILLYCRSKVFSPLYSP